MHAELETGLRVAAKIEDARRDALICTGFVSASCIVEFSIEDGTWWMPEDVAQLPPLIDDPIDSDVSEEDIAKFREMFRNMVDGVEE